MKKQFNKAYLYITPAIIGTLLFIVYPIIKTISLSFKSCRLKQLYRTFKESRVYTNYNEHCNLYFFYGDYIYITSHSTCCLAK